MRNLHEVDAFLNKKKVSKFTLEVEKKPNRTEILKEIEKLAQKTK